MDRGGVSLSPLSQTLPAELEGVHGAGWTLEPRPSIDSAAATPDGQPERDPGLTPQSPPPHGAQDRPRIDVCRLTPALGSGEGLEAPTARLDGPVDEEAPGPAD